MVYSYLSLLADDGDSILQFDIMKKALQKDVGHSYQVVVLLSLIKRVTVLTVCLVILKKQMNIHDNPVNKILRST